MKDIEWLKREVLGLRKIGNDKINQTEAEKEMGRVQKWAWNNCLDRIYDLIGKLDEPEVTLNGAFEKVSEIYPMTKEEVCRHLERVVAHGGKVTYGEQEVLSQEWIDEHKAYVREYNIGHYIQVEHLQNLLMPKQGLPVIPHFVAEWIKEMKQDERPLYSAMSSLMNKTNHEWAIWKRTNQNFSEIVAQAWLDGYMVEEEPLYYALIKGHELIKNEGVWTTKYWNFDTTNGNKFLSNQFTVDGKYLIKMSKSEWNKLGINGSNADFVRV